MFATFWRHLFELFLRPFLTPFWSDVESHKAPKMEALGTILDLFSRQAKSVILSAPQMKTATFYFENGNHGVFEMETISLFCVCLFGK